MKKVLGGLLVLLCFVLLGNVKAESFEMEGDEEINTSDSVDVVLSGIYQGAWHELDVSWNSFSFSFTKIGESIEDDGQGNQTIVRHYGFTPDFFVNDYGVIDESNAIYISNHSNVALSVGLNWTPNVAGAASTDADIVETFNYYHGDVTCALLEEQSPSTALSYNQKVFSDSACLSRVATVDDSETYYYLEPYYTLAPISLQNRNSYLIEGGYYLEDIEPAYQHKWVMDLEPVNLVPTDLTEDMTLGTLTITISDLD